MPVSLASLRPGQTCVITGFLVASVRSTCRALGLETGDRVTCRASSAHVLVLRSDRRAAILLEHDLARWVEIGRLPPPPLPRPPAGGLRTSGRNGAGSAA